MHKINVKTKLIAEFTTFITMAYTLLVIPSILKFSGINSLGLQGNQAAKLSTLNDPIVASLFTATYVESTAGIAEGGRTALTSLVVEILFLLSLFFSGLVGISPAEATAPALVIVGVLIVSSIKDVNFDDFTEALPAFFTIAIMPFRYSIGNRIAAGIIFYPIMKVFTGRHK